MTTEHDPLRELHRFREELARRHNYDVRSLLREPAEERDREGREVIPAPPRRMPDAADRPATSRPADAA